MISTLFFCEKDVLVFSIFFSSFFPKTTHINFLPLGESISMTIQYDFDGDNVWERTETFQNFKLDSNIGFENSAASDSSFTFSVEGSTYLEFSGGQVLMSVWQSSSNGAVVLLSVESSMI